MNRSKSLSSLLICAVLAVTVYAGDELLVLQQQQSSLRTLARILNGAQTSFAADDAFDSSMDACFQYIEQRQVNNLANLQTEMRLCSSTASAAKAELSRRSNDTRNALVANATDITNSLRLCEAEKDGLKFFTCYSQATAAGSQTLQSSSLVASDQVVDMRMNYQQVDFELSKCNTLCRNSYAATSAAIQREMQGCISGEFVPPPPSTARPTTTSTARTTPKSSTP